MSGYAEGGFDVKERCSESSTPPSGHFRHNWKTVRSWWLDGNRTAATSASFVIDGDGRIVHIHPGPMFYPSGAPADAEYDRDFRAIREAILEALSGKQSDR